MQLSELIFAIFIIYLIYKLVFNIIVPVSKVSSAVRDRMQQTQHGHGSQQTRNTAKPGSSSANKPTSNDSEYIDFEEIK